MKLLYTNYRPKIVLAMLFLCVGQLLVSCSKKGEIEKIVTGDGTKLMVKVVGVTDKVEISPANLKASASLKPAVKQSGMIPSEILSFEGFDAVVSVEQGSLKKNKVSIGSQAKGQTAAGELMAEAIEVGVKYRLLLYKADGTFVSSTLLTSGTTGEIDVEKGNDYDWYAVSYNNTDDVPDVNTANPTLNLPGGEDVLYASGDISIAAGDADGNKPLGIVFKHSLARVAVELNTMGMFAEMASAVVEVSGLAVKTATLDLKTGGLSNPVDHTQVIDFASFENVDPLYGDRKVAYVYTADVTPLTNLTVTIKDLSLELDDNTTRSFTTLLSANPSVFSFNVTPVLGANYTALVNLIESPLTLGSTRWARANLYYHGGHNPYRFHHTYAHTNQTNSYFPFGAKYTPAGTVKGDPCLDVYPQGIWRQPTSGESTSVTGVAGLGGATPTWGSTGSLQYFDYNAATGTAAPYPSNNLRFNMNGEATTVRLVNSLIEIQIGQYGDQVEVWTSSPLIGAGDLLAIGAWHYSGSSSTIPLVGRVNAISTAQSLLNVDLISIEVAGVSLKNVRCVRAAI